MAVKKNKVAERLGVEEDVENFWKEMRAKEEKKRLIKSSMGKSWEGQMVKQNDYPLCHTAAWLLS